MEPHTTLEVALLSQTIDNIACDSCGKAAQGINT
jgi:hypothetical protein